MAAASGKAFMIIHHLSFKIPETPKTHERAEAMRELSLPVLLVSREGRADEGWEAPRFWSTGRRDTQARSGSQPCCYQRHGGEFAAGVRYVFVAMSPCASSEGSRALRVRREASRQSTARVTTLEISHGTQSNVQQPHIARGGSLVHVATCSGQSSLLPMLTKLSL